MHTTPLNKHPLKEPIGNLTEKTSSIIELKTERKWLTDFRHGNQLIIVL